ncbi:hypothetical protein QR680_009356 [Steinernema hermaphroditum]|uniref:Uncharacterized protein n=1 Tax=Steinernema hermaphroditum TaxID=289476 RepID=A0AA39ILS5_9BILA|nr:hypothetical protein QR680_009356 [Steinernema hermaphroditum]
MDLAVVLIVVVSVLLGVLILVALLYGIYRILHHPRVPKPPASTSATPLQIKKGNVEPLRSLFDEDDLSRSVIVGSMTTSSEQDNLDDPFATNSSSQCADKATKD